MVARQKSAGHFLLGVNSFIPNKAPVALRNKCAELLTRINYDLTLGCFEMDYADGEIRFRTSVMVPGADITPGIIEHLIRANLHIVEENYPQIMAVLYAGVSPEDALKPKAEINKPETGPRFDFN